MKYVVRNIYLTLIYKVLYEVFRSKKKLRRILSLVALNIIWLQMVSEKRFMAYSVQKHNSQ